MGCKKLSVPPDSTIRVPNKKNRTKVYKGNVQIETLDSELLAAAHSPQKKRSVHGTPKA